MIILELYIGIVEITTCNVNACDIKTIIELACQSRRSSLENDPVRLNEAREYSSSVDRSM